MISIRHIAYQPASLNRTRISLITTVAPSPFLGWKTHSMVQHSYDYSQIEHWYTHHTDYTPVFDCSFVCGSYTNDTLPTLRMWRWLS